MEGTKKKRVRLKDSHRWTEEQNKVLLQKVLEAVDNNPKKYEQPTAQQFYKNRCQDSVLDGIDWLMMRNKMRYLKSTYIKAIQWREQVGSELFKSDKAHVEARMKTICPYYTQLNKIFEPMLPADPIRLTENDFNKYLKEKTSRTENDLSTDNTDYDDSEFDTIHNDVSIVVPKIENEIDDQPPMFEEASVRPMTKHKTASHTVDHRQHDFFQESIEQEHVEEDSSCYKNQFELECAKFAFERRKLLLDLQYQKDQKEISRLTLNFEKDKLEFEKRKFMEDIRMRKYEIDKQFEAKKLEVEKDERLRRLELEFKFRYKTNDEVMDYNEKSDYL